MRKFLLLAIFFSPLVIFAQNNAKYVAIKTGANMRDKPDVSGKVIEKIPYATKITLLEDNEQEKSIKTENLNGYWRKVKYNNKTGYIVDSYLFPVPPPKANTKTIKDYFTQITTLFGSKLVVKSGTITSIEEGGWELHKQLYKNGAEWHHFAGYEYGSETYFIPEFTMQEAFLLLRMIPEFEEVIGEKDVFPLADTVIKKGETEYRIKVEKEQISTDYPWIKKITIEFESGAVYSFEMYQVESQIVIFFGAGV